MAAVGDPGREDSPSDGASCWLTVAVENIGFEDHLGTVVLIRTVDSPDSGPHPDVEHALELGFKWRLVQLPEEYREGDIVVHIEAEDITGLQISARGFRDGSFAGCVVANA